MSDTEAHTPDNDQSLDFMRQIQLQMRRGEEENGVLRNIYKRAQSAGEKPPILRAVIRMLRQYSPEEVIDYLREMVRLLNIRRIDVNADTLFAGMMLNVTEKSQREDSLWDAGTAGYKAGRDGVKIDECPWNAGSELFDEWVRNWHQGQAAIARELGPDSKPADASRARPRRGKGAAQEPEGEQMQAADKAPRKAAAKKNGAAKKAAAPKKKGAGKKAAVPLLTADTSIEEPTSVH